MELMSEAFDEDESIPDTYVRDGDDRSPPLSWTDLPEETKCLSLVVEDPDAPNGTFTHWLLWNIPVTRAGLTEDLPHRGRFSDEMRQGDNDFGERGWSGPRPPTGETHRYVFRLFALDAPLSLEDGASREDVEAAMEGHVLDEASLIGRYSGNGR